MFSSFLFKSLKVVMNLIEKIKGEKPMEPKDIELMREWLRSGMPVDDAVAEYLEETPYETEDSYRIKSERLSECLIEW